MTFRSWNGRAVLPIVAPAGNLYWVRTDRRFASITLREARVLEQAGTRNEIAYEAPE